MDKSAKTRLRTVLSKHAFKGSQVQVCVALPVPYVEQLRALSQRDHEPMAHYFRDALRWLLVEKYGVDERLLQGQASDGRKRPFRGP